MKKPCNHSDPVATAGAQSFAAVVSAKVKDMFGLGGTLTFSYPDQIQVPFGAMLGCRARVIGSPSTNSSRSER